MPDSARRSKAEDAQILVAGIQHETNGFSPLRTSLDDFRHYQYADATTLLDRFEETGTEVGGAIAAAATVGATLLPSVFAAATPSGKVLRSAFDELLDQICNDARRLRDQIDGALIVLHGSMLTEDEDEADALLIERVRAELGDTIPVIATLDLHANISTRLVRAADMLIGYRTFPHTDMADRGQEALIALHRLISGAPRPIAAFRKLPLLPSSEKQITDRGAIGRAMAVADETRALSGIQSVTVAAGYPFADVEHLGMSVLVYGDERSDELANALSQQLWHDRAELVAALTPLESAVKSARTGRAPVILVDAADNVGGGAPGDGTAVLEQVLESPPGPTVLVIWDPDSAEHAYRSGASSPFERAVGSHTKCGNGSPVFIRGQIVFAAPLDYERSGSYMRGTHVQLGVTAVVKCGDIFVVLTSRRLMPFDTDHLEALGIQPENMQAIVVKSGSAWRAAFGSIAGDVVNVDAPGTTTQRFDRLPYTKIAHPLYPIDRFATWQVAGH